MIDGIINTLNLTLETTGRIDKRYCLTEQRTSTGENATTVPYAIEPNGQLKAVDYGKPSLSWWRITSPFSIEEVSTTSAVNKKQATYSLRLVVMYMRKESTADNGFTPAWLAEDLGSVLTQSNGDLKTVLKASDVRVNVTSTDINTTRVWNDEFKDLEFKDPKYVTCLIAFELSVTVIARPDCWQTECEYDTDILHVFDFCKTGTFNRLTDDQKECLTTALCGVCADATVHNSDSSYSTTVASGGDLPLPDNVITLKDTAANILSTTNVPATNAADIEASDSTNEVNGVDISEPTVAEGTHNQVIENSAATPIGTAANPSVIADSQAQVNGVNTELIPATVTHDQAIHDSAGADVGTGANPSVVSDSTIQNNATPTWTDTVEAEGTLTLAQAKALDSDGATTLLADYIPAADGFMFTCTPGSSVASLAVGLSGSTPSFGGSITITATPTNITPTSYTFIVPLKDGNLTRVTQVGNTLVWEATYTGVQKISVEATDGALTVSNETTVTVNYAFGNALTLNGTNWLTTPTNSLNSIFNGIKWQVEMWFNTNSLANFPMLLSATSGSGFFFELGASNIYAVVGTGGNWTQVLSNSTRYQLIFQKTGIGNNISVYLNGTSLGAISAPVGNLIVQAAGMYIGRYSSGGFELNGRIKDVRVWQDFNSSSAQRTALYNSGNGAHPSAAGKFPDVWYWLNADAKDYGRLGLHATAVNSPTYTAF